MTADDADPPDDEARGPEDDPAGDTAEERRLFAHRIAEALLFASATPLSEAALAARMPAGVPVAAVMADLQALYAGRGVQLVRVGGQWMFRTADDLGFLLRHEAREQRKLSRAALETLAIVAYHQPVTRAEVEEIRGVSTVKGSMDVLMEVGWVRMRGRRRSPGRPVTYGTTEAFLIHFGLDSLSDLPGLDELRGAGLLEGNIPPGFSIPTPRDEGLRADEEPLDDVDPDEGDFDPGDRDEDTSNDGNRSRPDRDDGDDDG
ncbi:SMC-Scp complex subunit ScpB [Mongoliimonas terrestris]|uniref:SMC-Scp complex subunit ScpB n=1 Tax=Mongoliimonas terrestris TaxID=1709001 RepID=UPI0009495379